MISTTRENEKQQAIYVINSYACSYRQWQVAIFLNENNFFFLLESVATIKQSKGNFSTV